MKRTNASPVYCSHCNAFAVAEMSGTPRCWNCLYAEVRADNSLSEEIAPLAVVKNAILSFDSLQQLA